MEAPMRIGGDGLRISVVRYDKPLPAMPVEDSEATPVEGMNGWMYGVEDGSGSWVVEEANSYLRRSPNSAPPPSPLTPVQAMHARPQAPTPSTAPRAIDSDELWSPTQHNDLDAFPSSEQPVFASPSRMPDDADESHPDGSLHPPYASYRPPHPTYTPASLTPALSSAGSSSASTRSSAYTSSGSALAHSDYGNHVHVATPSDNEDDHPGSPLAIGVGITSDQVNNPHASTLVANPNLNPNSISHSRVPIDQARWSHSYSGSIRSRTSLVRPNGNGMHDAGANTSPPLNSKKSYDASWQPDERDEVDLTSGDETDETDLDQDDLDDDDQEEEAHQAVVLAEEGRGLIVHGEGVPTVQLQVQNGTTHLLLASSSTPNALPPFLTPTLQRIHPTLVALDISRNYLVALPPALQLCSSLEELNVSANPIRALPVFIAHLTSLRVLIADSTGIGTLPHELSGLDKLHTLSIRRNKLHALPSWLCVLGNLEVLLVDQNPFQGPWKALVDPLLAREVVQAQTPGLMPSTPVWPSASINKHSVLNNNTNNNIVPDSDTDGDESSGSPPAQQNLGVGLGVNMNMNGNATEDEDTIMPGRGATPAVSRAAAPVPALPSPALPSVPLPMPSYPNPHPDPDPDPDSNADSNSAAPAPAPTSGTAPGDAPTRPIARTRTTPNRSYYEKARKSAGDSVHSSGSRGLDSQAQWPQGGPGAGGGGRNQDSGYFGEREIRRMKSAGDVRRAASAVGNGNGNGGGGGGDKSMTPVPSSFNMAAVRPYTASSYASSSSSFVTGTGTGPGTPSSTYAPGTPSSSSVFGFGNGNGNGNGNGRPALSHYGTSGSTSNLLSGSTTNSKFTSTSLGPHAGLAAASVSASSTAASSPSTSGFPGEMMRSTSSVRPKIDMSIWDNLSGTESQDEGPGTGTGAAVSRASGSTTRSSKSEKRVREQQLQQQASQMDRSRSKSVTREGETMGLVAKASERRKRDKERERAEKERERAEGKEKGTRWGFLKKMSMGKMRGDESNSGAGSGSNSRPGTAGGGSGQASTAQNHTRPQIKPLIHHGEGENGSANAQLQFRSASTPNMARLMMAKDNPTIDVRLSSTGTLGMDMVNISAHSHSPPEMTFSHSPTTMSVVDESSADGGDSRPGSSSAYQTTTQHQYHLSSASGSGSGSPQGSPTLFVPISPTSPGTTRSAKRRSFLPIDSPAASGLSVPSPFIHQQQSHSSFASSSYTSTLVSMSMDGEGDDAFAGDDERRTPSPLPPIPIETNDQYIRREEERMREAYMRALRSVMAYLRDMNDLSLAQQPLPPPTTQQQVGPTMSMYGYGGSPTSEGANGSAAGGMMGLASVAPGQRSRRPTVVEADRVVSSDGSSSFGSPSIAPSKAGSSGSLGQGQGQGQLRSVESMARIRSMSTSQTLSVATTDSAGSGSGGANGLGGEERKYKDDAGKRAMIVREIVETERTYVRGLQELDDIYIRPASAPVNLLGNVGSAKETVIPAAERKLAFGGLESLFSFHKESFLPALERAAAPLMKNAQDLALEDADGQLSTRVATAVANTFVSSAPFMKMYSSYINNFDNSVQRIKQWVTDRGNTGGTVSPPTMSPSSSGAQMVGLGLAISAISSPGITPDSTGPNLQLSSSQRKRIKSFLKRCRLNPRHSQLNLEGYLLLPVQRIPRYRLLLEELGRATPPGSSEYIDPLDKAVTEISSLATNMNEGKRESESRRKLVQWQARIRGRFPSPLVQPHRRLIMDGPLLLTRVVRKATIAFELIDSQGDASNVQVDCLSPEQTPRALVGILCNDLMVLCRDPSEGRDPNSFVDLWAVLRMQTLPQPASIVHGNVLRLVDNKAILYFEASSTSDALTWFRAINLHIPSSKT